MEIIAKTELAIKSRAFKDGKKIPARNTCDGENVSPPLTVGNVPAETQSLAVIVEDADAPGGSCIHWVEWNIPPFEPIEEDMHAGIPGSNSLGSTGYSGPCPDSGSHRYVFTVYALDAELHLVAGSGKEDLLDAMEGHLLGSGSITGVYERKKGK